jgi:alpha-beta hydrolase superfamily lysophospholipase
VYSTRPVTATHSFVVTVSQPDGAETAATVSIPNDPIPRPVVLFGFPGAGYGRRYYGVEHPALEGPGQAAYHAAHGFVFVACDHLCVGDSTMPEDPFALTLEAVADANAVTVASVLERLREGTLAPEVEPLEPAAVIGIGHSMGGCLLTVQQARHRSFDGAAFLGWSQNRIAFPTPSGDFLTRDVPPRGADLRGYRFEPWTWDEVRHAYHYDDVPTEILDADLAWAKGDFTQPPPSWISFAMPPVALSMMAPGVVAAEAAEIDVPVFLGFGERDTTEDPIAEPAAYRGSSDITLSVFPRMAHMHNFATTRQQLWRRLAHWATGAAST